MPLLNNKCKNCHTLILGRQKSLSHHRLSPASHAKKCKWETRTRTVNKGKLLQHKKEKRIVARCPVCGRSEKLEWVCVEVDEEWKDDKCG